MRLDSGSSRSNPYDAAGCIGLTLLTVAVYARLPELGFFAEWDDRLYMVARPEVRDWFEATWRERLLTPDLGYPVPIPTFVYYLLRQLPGEWVVPAAHLTNGVVHLANVWLVYWNAVRRMQRRRFALVATGLWAAHPLLVETVAWLTDLKVLLATAFVLSAARVWEGYCTDPTAGRAGFVAVLLVAALGCRPEAVVAIPLFLGELWFRRRDEFGRLRTIGFAAGAILVGSLYSYVAVTGQFSVFAEDNIAPPPDLGWAERLLRMGAAFSLQIRHTVLPLELHPTYPAESYALAREAWIGAALCAILAVGTWYSVRKVPESAWGWAVWWGFYLPASGIVFLPRFTGDTYMYLPLVGLTFAGTSALGGALTRQRRRIRLVAAGAVVVWIAVLGFRAHTQTLRWQNKFTLWKPVLRERPDAVRGNWMVGAAYFEAGEYGEAIQHYEHVYGEVARRGRIPLRMAKAYEKTGDIRRAVGVTADILSYEGKTPPGTGLYLVELVVSHGLEVDEDSRVGRAFQRAVDSLLESERERLDPEFSATAAEWFAESGREQRARAFAERALRARSDSCRAWDVLERTGGGESAELPNRPEECRR